MIPNLFAKSLQSTGTDVSFSAGDVDERNAVGLPKKTVRIKQNLLSYRFTLDCVKNGCGTITISRPCNQNAERDSMHEWLVDYLFEGWPLSRSTSDRDIQTTREKIKRTPRKWILHGRLLRVGVCWVVCGLL